MTRYCEFIGTEDRSPDEVPRSKRVCEYAGFSHCILYLEDLKETSEGWRLCCEECEKPFYVTQE